MASSEFIKDRKGSLTMQSIG